MACWFHVIGKRFFIRPLSLSSLLKTSKNTKTLNQFIKGSSVGHKNYISPTNFMKMLGTQKKLGKL
jgi:hypothetical protein